MTSRVEAELESYAFDPSCALFLPLYRLDGSSFASQDKYGHACTNYGSVWTPQGRTFDGDTDAVTCGTGDSLDMAALSIVLVITMGVFQDWQRLISFPNTFSHPYIIGETNVAGKLGFTWGADADHSKRLTVPLEEGRRYSFAVTYKNDTPAFYLDGEPCPCEFYLNHHSWGAGEVTIGNKGSRDAGTDCTIPLVMTFNRVLTPQEISRHSIVAKEALG